MKLDNCTLISLPKISDPRGNLTYIEQTGNLPFDIQRVYYLYDVPAQAERGGHAHRALSQLIIAVSGSFEVTLDSGSGTKTILLNTPWQGLYVCPMIWRTLQSFSSGSICLVLASLPYDEADYYRNYDEFILDVRKENR